MQSVLRSAREHLVLVVPGVAAVVVLGIAALAGFDVLSLAGRYANVGDEQRAERLALPQPSGSPCGGRRPRGRRRSVRGGDRRRGCVPAVEPAAGARCVRVRGGVCDCVAARRGRLRRGCLRLTDRRHSEDSRTLPDLPHAVLPHRSRHRVPLHAVEGLGARLPRRRRDSRAAAARDPVRRRGEPDDLVRVTRPRGARAGVPRQGRRRASRDTRGALDRGDAGASCTFEYGIA